MLERVIENWLTKVGERGYQTAFTQALAQQGYRVLHEVQHHSHEHGKDLVAYDPEGRLTAFQLKGGDLGIAELEEHWGQLSALAETSISYPGMTDPKLPERAVFVVSGTLTPPARDRLQKKNEGHLARGFPPVELVELPGLTALFLKAHGSYLPQTPQDFKRLLEPLVADGRNPFPVMDWLRFLDRLFGGIKQPNKEGAKALGSALLFTSYATTAWKEVDNHYSCALAWLSMALATLRWSAVWELEDEQFAEVLQLCLDAAYNDVDLMLDEVVARDNLVIPGLTEPSVSSTRALLICGLTAATYLSSVIDGSEERFASKARTVLARESGFVKAAGEAAAAHLLLTASALHHLNDGYRAAVMMLLWVSELSRSNAPRSEDAAPDPYHELPDLLLASITGESLEEKWEGRAYTLHIGIEWMARREGRDLLERIWTPISRVMMCEYLPDDPRGLLAARDDQGQLEMWNVDRPQSWATLRSESRSLQESQLPAVLWRHTQFLPFLPLLLPYRLTSAVAKAIDYAWEPALVDLTLDVSADGQLAGLADA